MQASRDGCTCYNETARKCPLHATPVIARSLSFRVYCTPGAQGSKRHVGHGVLLEQSKRVAPWREAVSWAAVKALAEAGLVGKQRGLCGAIHTEIVFSFKRPKDCKRKYPSVAPDVDKAVRSTFDALTQAGAYEDDSRVVSLVARKVYVGSDDPDALDAPGAIIRLREVA